LHSKLSEKLQEMKRNRKGFDTSNRKAKRLKTETKNPSHNKEEEEEEKEEEEGEEEEEEEEDIKFSTFDFSTGKPQPSYLVKKKRKKADVLLQEAEQKMLLMEKIKNTEEGKKLLQDESWKKVYMKATGQKVKDNPKLIKQSMKKEEKKKQKSASAWEERKGAEEKKKADKQAKRTENIKNRKIAKKTGKPIKKQKRPGFEGRKRDFLNKDKGNKKE